MPKTIINGRVVFPNEVRNADIAVESGHITAVTKRDLDDADGPLLFPGFIDLHVHAREYPRPEGDDPPALARWHSACAKETFSTAGQAAINGGVTLFAAMPNDPIPPDNREAYERKRALTSASPCPVVLFAAVTRSSEPWEDVPYKVYLDREPSSLSFSSWKELAETLARFKGARIFIHAEDPEILRDMSADGPRWITRPPSAEVRATERMLEITARYDLRTHFCHISTEAAVRLIQEYNRSSSRPVTCEVTPHHLFFSVDERGVCAVGGRAVSMADMMGCNPPLRSEEDRRFLVAALREGTIDILATDHAPHTLQDKADGAPGMPHLDTLGPFAGWLMGECGLSPARVAEVLSEGPARIIALDLDAPHGRVEPGYAASFTELDVAESTVILTDGIQGGAGFGTRCGWSPFAGMSLPASVRRTIILGKEHARA